MPHVRLIAVPPPPEDTARNTRSELSREGSMDCAASSVAMHAERSFGPFPLKTGAPKQSRLFSPAACWLAAAKVEAEIERDGLRRSPYSKQWGIRENRRNRSRAPDRLPASHVRSDETGCRHNIIIEFFLSPAGTTRGGEKRIATGKKSSSSASVVPRVPRLALRIRDDKATV